MFLRESARVSCKFNPDSAFACVQRPSDPPCPHPPSAALPPHSRANSTFPSLLPALGAADLRRRVAAQATTRPVAWRPCVVCRRARCGSSGSASCSRSSRSSTAQWRSGSGGSGTTPAAFGPGRRPRRSGGATASWRTRSARCTPRRPSCSAASGCSGPATTRRAPSRASARSGTSMPRRAPGP